MKKKLNHIAKLIVECYEECGLNSIYIECKKMICAVINVS